MSTLIKRSTFLKGVALAGAAAFSGKFAYEWFLEKGRIPCRTLGPSKDFGHMLRDKSISQVSSIEPSFDEKVIIVGGGMAGLSAAWWLLKKGFSNFKLLELESEVGGNSRFGKNEISAYPWGAHYVPIANDESEYVRMLFEELGVIESYSSTGVPVYNELFLCHDPQERLYKDGTFQEGLVPKRGLQQVDNDEIARFFEKVREFRSKRGADGKPTFAIPLDLSSQDPQLLELDKISMSEWLAKNDFKSRPLLWYINYCCKDDYGSRLENVSAWAGLHYFAGRTGRAVNAETNSVLTWPEGNGYLVNRLKEKLGKHVVSNAMVAKVKRLGDRMEISYMDTSSKKLLSAKADLVIFAVPRFLSKYLIEDFSEFDRTDHAQLVYAPWIVANISLKSLPSSKGESIAWDNVNYYSESLGYVVATHQDITTRQSKTVITYYYPLSDDEPKVARGKLLKLNEREWSERICADLEKMHRDIRSDIISIDFWPWGHGMIRPSVGFIWGEGRRKMKDSNGLVYFAHSDMSGMSNFEEAQFQGVCAAKRVLEKLGVA